MIGALIGTAAGLIIIFILSFLKRFDKVFIYGLILSAIGFLYVGFAWTDTTQGIINSVQAIFFLFLAYFGIKKNLYYMIAGYFLHGIWDLLYSFHADASLLPPQYDWFCLTIDFVMGGYLFIFKDHLRPMPT